MTYKIQLNQEVIDKIINSNNKDLFEKLRETLDFNSINEAMNYVEKYAENPNQIIGLQWQLNGELLGFDTIFLDFYSRSNDIDNTKSISKLPLEIVIKQEDNIILHKTIDKIPIRYLESYNKKTETIGYIAKIDS
ncbi:hypothetical protein CL617_05680 [archaeon]|nr:hypothetical protein [archaeon]|tara:strand:+ start:936 stop:1340 length:405 start_codon:yes stop_codon:yes gene_type:complete